MMATPSASNSHLTRGGWPQPSTSGSRVRVPEAALSPRVAAWEQGKHGGAGSWEVEI